MEITFNKKLNRFLGVFITISIVMGSINKTHAFNVKTTSRTVVTEEAELFPHNPLDKTKKPAFIKQLMASPLSNKESKLVVSAYKNHTKYLVDTLKIVSSKKDHEVKINLQDPDYNPDQVDRLIDVFFKVYPKLVKDFNAEAPKSVTITIDTAYDGVAYAHNGKVVISQAWLQKNPEDIDVVTHEVMHIVQSYPPGSGPGWLVEGIADYVRDTYGVNNKAANWSLPDLKDSHHYTNSYRIAARFLKWVAQKKDRTIIQKLDTALREKTYTDAIWQKHTGLTLDELWDAYKRENLS